MSGMPAPKTFRVYGTIHGHYFTILVDGGSTHNFVQLRIAKFLGLPSTSIQPLPVMVGDGGVIDCNLRFPQVSITIQGHHFINDLFGLDLHGADLVLGVQLLRELGPVTIDYTSLSMHFTHMGLLVQLIADIPVRPPRLQPANSKECFEPRLSQPYSISTPPHLLLHHFTPPPPFWKTNTYLPLNSPTFSVNSTTFSANQLPFPLPGQSHTTFTSPLTRNQ